MKTGKKRPSVVPSAVSLEEFKRILDNLANAEPVARKDAKLGRKKTTGTDNPTYSDNGSDELLVGHGFGFSNRSKMPSNFAFMFRTLKRYSNSLR